MKDNRTENRKTGDRGERRTALYLLIRGYRILERNFTFGHKEVDIIAKRGKTIAFVEVKTRGPETVLSPSASVTHAKRRNIIAAAKGYCMLHDTSGCCIRFDVSEVTTKGGINYIKSAFTAD